MLSEMRAKRFEFENFPWNVKAKGLGRSYPAMIFHIKFLRAVKPRNVLKHSAENSIALRATFCGHVSDGDRVMQMHETMAHRQI